MNRLIVGLVALCLAHAAAGKELQVPSTVPYAKPEMVASNIREECQLPQAMAESLQKYLKKDDVELKVSDFSTGVPKQGRALQVEIFDAVSAGNAFIGHRKFVSLSVKLFEDGNLLKSFSPSRHSAGGAFAGFKGSCAVLVRCTETLGKDVAAWYRKASSSTETSDAAE